MSDLEGILQDDAVEIVETEAEFDAEAFESWQSAAEEQRNRAVSGVIRDVAERLLLVQYRSEERHTGWRLPGSAVGRVEEFEGRLRRELSEQFDAIPDAVRPFRVHAHTGRHGGEAATFYYVLCDVSFPESPGELLAGRSPETIETGWFDDPPADLVNPDVVPRLFGR